LNIIPKIYKNKPVICKETGDPMLIILISNFISYFKSVGAIRNGKKRVPPFIFELDNESKLIMFKYFFYNDGGINSGKHDDKDEPQIRITGSNRTYQLNADLHKLLRPVFPIKNLQGAGRGINKFNISVKDMPFNPLLPTHRQKLWDEMMYNWKTYGTIKKKKIDKLKMSAG